MHGQFNSRTGIRRPVAVLRFGLSSFRGFIGLNNIGTVTIKIDRRGNAARAESCNQGRVPKWQVPSF